MNHSKLLIFGSLVVSLVVAILVLFDTVKVGTLDAIGWLAIAAVLYLASLLVP